MSNDYINILENRAEGEFTLEHYNNALVIYSLILKDEPNNKNAIIGVYLSDIGLNNSEKAQSIFDYFLTIKTTKDSFELMKNFISSLEEEENNIIKLINSFQDKENIKDGISYEDFLIYIENIKNSKTALEDLSFSTRIIIKSKKEYIAFINKLILIGEQKLAEQFLDTYESDFRQDQDIYHLYSKIKN